jgi:hypothetical protein
MILGRPDMIIVVSPELESFYRFVKGRQEAEYGGLVVLLDRRLGERRTPAASQVETERRRRDRRTASDPARALLSVLGFTVLHRDGERYVA